MRVSKEDNSGCELEKHLKNKGQLGVYMCVWGRCDSVSEGRYREPYGLWLRSSPPGGVRGAVYQCINLAGFNGQGRQQPTALHSDINSTSACLPSGQMERGSKLQELCTFLYISFLINIPSFPQRWKGGKKHSVQLNSHKRQFFSCEWFLKWGFIVSVLIRTSISVHSSGKKNRRHRYI